MTALQELSVRLSVFTRSIPLPALSNARGHLFRRQRHPLIRVSASTSSPPAAAADYSPSRVPLFGRASYRHLFAGADDLNNKGGASERSRGPSAIDSVSLANVEISDGGVDSPTEQQLLVSVGVSDEGREDATLPNEFAQGYVKFAQNDAPKKEVQGPNYLTMSDKQLFAKCRMDTYRASGPGGQHRNKTDSAVRLTHSPTGLVAQAADDRSQHINRSLALTRLRQIIALEVRDPVDLDGYKPPQELVRILPNGTGGKRGSSQRIGPNHPDFVLGMKALMDLLYATGGSVSDSGKVLGLTTGSLSKLITSNNLLWQGVNKLRSLKMMLLGSEAAQIISQVLCLSDCTSLLHRRKGNPQFKGDIMTRVSPPLLSDDGAKTEWQESTRMRESAPIVL